MGAALPLWSSAAYVVPLPDGHRFPIEKYARLRQRIIHEGVASADAVRDPERAPLEALRRVHTDDYLSRFTGGRLTDAEVRRLGFPWSEGLVERSFRATGGTLHAARAALTAGIAMNLAGGTHHAFADHGEGFCVFNDVAIAIRALQDDGLASRVAVLDLDVHQGNGTHHIFAEDARVFTFSMHGRRNYPFHKVPGTYDLELEDGTGDDEYLERLADALPQVLERAAPDVVFYLAGADPHEGDRLGRLRLTFAGLARRDRLVLDTCRAIGLPVVIVIAGGYGANIEDTVTVHVNTARIAAEALTYR